MPTPYHLDIRQHCRGCTNDSRVLCRIEPAALMQLESISFSTVYPRGSLLFVEGHEPRGVFIICAGRVKLSESSSEGRTVILRICEPGDVLGLSASILNSPCEVTAETLEPTQITFIKRQDFLRLMTTHAEICHRTVELLSKKYGDALKEIRALGLAHSASQRFAKLLLDWSDRHGERVARGTRLRILLTHTELAQMIGTTRETVTRQIGALKRTKIIEVKGSTVTLLNRAALEQMVSS